MTNPPTILTNGAMNTPEGCSSISDAAGNILFYTNGYHIWNKSHQIMANGLGVGTSGSSVTVQSALIVKQPGNSNIYYVFSLNYGFPSLLSYSIVDINLASGQGSVTVKGVTLLGTKAEQLGAVKHCNGIDTWIICPEVISGMPGTISLCVYLLTSSGLNTTPVVSPFTNFVSAQSAIKFSPQGKKIAMCERTGTLATAVIADFDAATGIISNSLIVGPVYIAGCEFSPDGSKFYCNSNFVVYQWDLCAGTPSAIIASQTSLTPTAPGLNQMQLAQNGKIYIAAGGQSLHVIHNPNLAGTNCNFVLNGQSVSPRSIGLGLPNFVVSYFNTHPPPPPFTFTTNPQTACNTASFTSNLTSTVFGCTANGYSLTSLAWNFGDPSSSNNTAFTGNPVHAFSGPGIYTVSLIYYYTCGGGTDTLKQVVNIDMPNLSVSTTSINCANLGSATVTSIGSTSPISYTWMPVAQTGSVASGLSPGVYSLTSSSGGGTCVMTQTLNFQPLVPLTAVISVPDSVNCFGAASATGAVTNLSGGSGNQTYLWTNGIQSYQTATTTAISAGIWSVNVTDALTGCQVKQTFLVTQPPPSALSLSYNTYSVCAGSSIVLTGTNSGGRPGYNYTWTNGPAIDTYTVSETLPGLHVYTLNSTDANNCLTSNTIAVDFVPNPTITVSNVSICPLKSGTLTASGATSYTWTLAPYSLTSTPLSQTSVLTDSPVMNTEYAVVGSALGCTAMATASIILHPVPIPVFQNNSPVCNGQSLVLNGSGGNSYYWTGPSGFNSALSSPTINPANPGQSGVYNLTVTSVNGCTATTSSTLTVNPTPTLSAAGATVCSSQTLNLISNSEPGATYSWSGPLNFNSATQNPSIGSLSLNHTGNYSVVATSTLGCTNTAVVHASVVAPPSLTGQLSSHSLCSQAFNGSPNSITLTAGGANTYSIVTVPDMSISNPGGPVSNLIAIPPNTGAGSATLSGSNGVCTVTMSLTFSIIPNPSVTIASTPIICAGETYTYTSQGATSYTWSSATPGFTTYNNGGVAVAHPSINAVFSVIGGSLGCFSATKTSSITVNPLPVISITPAQPTVCLYRSTPLTASGTATSYFWTSAPGLFKGSGSTVSVSPLTQQVYTVTGELDNCFASTTITVDVRALPEPTINTAKSAYCEDENITLSGEGGVAFEWRGPNSLYYQKQVISSQSAGGSGSWQFAGGVYSLTVTDANGCQATATKQITIYNSPEGSLLGYKESGCVPLCTDYHFKGNGAAITGNWTINNQSFGEKFRYCFPEVGTYTISGAINDNNTSCTNRLEFVVTVYPKPEADFNYLPLHPIENLDEVKFTNTSIGDTRNWNWYFLNNSGYQSSEENTSYLFSEPGEYPVAFIVTDQNFCQDTAMKVVKVEADFTIYIPDAFTPNNDGLNDVFKPVVRSSKLYTLAVFDRWGQRIFYSTSPESGWDGSFMGAECKMDVYSYQISLSTLSGEKKEYTGHVSLVR